MRNKVIFHNCEPGGVIKQSQDFFNNMMDSVRENGLPSRSVTLPDPALVGRWTKPPVGFMKVNVDEAIHPHLSATGVVIRNAEGRLIYCEGNIYHQCSPSEVEALAFRDGMVALLNIGFSSAIVEGDNAEMASLLLKKDSHPPWRVRHIIAAGRSILHLNNELKIQHVRRSANHCAHLLAKRLIKMLVLLLGLLLPVLLKLFVLRAVTFFSINERQDNCHTRG